jgi:hypothetical protein
MSSPTPFDCTRTGRSLENHLGTHPVHPSRSPDWPVELRSFTPTSRPGGLPGGHLQSSGVDKDRRGRNRNPSCDLRHQVRKIAIGLQQVTDHSLKIRSF